MDELIIATHQPNYIPWMGYFYKISKCDVFVFLDDIQFSKTGSHNYHRIKTPNGLQKLKIPVKHRFTDPINNVMTNDSGGWKERHLSAIEENYKEAPYFNTFFSEFKDVLLKDSGNLATLNVDIIRFFMRKFSLKTKTIFSSELGLDTSLKGEDRILNICSKLNATIYYSGRGAMAYQKEENFEKIGVKLIYDKFEPVEYNQLWGEFIANVSVIDYVMNHGFDWQYFNKLVEQKI